MARSTRRAPHECVCNPSKEKSAQAFFSALFPGCFEQVRSPGAELVLGLTSAGRMSRSLPLPSLVVAQEAIRDEGTPYHYVAAGNWVESNSALAGVFWRTGF
jgi:hypothetical protein